MCILFIYSCNSGKEEKIDYIKHIQKYEKLLLKQPDNCFYIQQVAGAYQMLENFEKAIDYYQRTKENHCRDNKIYFFNKFQMGICYYLIMDRDNGIRYMNEAIKGAEKIGDNTMLKIFISEKKFWLKKWDTIKDLKWNKGKSQGS